MEHLQSKLHQLYSLHESERLKQQWAERQVQTHARAVAVLRTKIEVLEERIERERQREH